VAHWSGDFDGDDILILAMGLIKKNPKLTDDEAIEQAKVLFG